MHVSHTASRRRLATVVVLTLLPWPAVWLGLYRLDNIFWTFALYHGLCLAPAVIWGRGLWMQAFRMPTRREWRALAIAVAVSLPLSVAAYAAIGGVLMDRSAVLGILTSRGFHTRLLIPLGLYFVPVNAVMEELFWRGVVLNTLRGTDETIWTLGALWTAFTFAGWHYMVIRLLLRPGWAELAIFGIMIAGVFLAWLYHRTRTVSVPILWHALVFDLAIMAVFAALLNR
jgi:membrane protease YdiL (CAAX protease family)